MTRVTFFSAALSLAFGALVNAQTPALEVGALYECPNSQSFKVISCAGARDSDQCDVQSYAGGEPTLRGNSTRQQVMSMVPRCKAQKAAAKSAADTTKAGKASAPAASAKPPKPGLVSCAGKIEGRYAPSGGGPGPLMTFKAGKVTMSGPLVDPEEVECWMGDGKIYLHKPGEPNDLPIDINDDGSLQTPFGELKRKGN